MDVKIKKSIAFALIFCAILIIACSAFAAALSRFEVETLEYINQYRAEHGLAALMFNEKLQALAREHSHEMYQSHTLGHQNFMQRYRKSGRRACVENAGVNSPTSLNQFVGWRNSPGHQRNLVDRKVKYAGIAQVGPYVTFFACD
jgi:uncharacterized protein YkwD